MITDLIDYVSFRGEKLTLVWKDEEPFVAVRPVCERLGLDWKAQHRKLSADIAFNRGHMTTVAEDGKLREMLCLHATQLPLWLASISPSRVKPELREALIAYRSECSLVLFHHVKARLLGERDAATSTLVRLQADLIVRKPLWGKVERMVQADFTFEAIWRAVKRPRHVVQEALGDLLRLGFIKGLPEGTPYPQPARPLTLDQLALFPEG